MLVHEYLKYYQSLLEKNNITTARLDTLVLLEDITCKDRAWLLVHLDYELSDDQTSKLNKLLNRRCEHEPLAYLREKTEFYGRDFVLTHDVLEPRPESENMIDLLRSLMASNPSSLNNSQSTKSMRIADIGAGSGAIGITAALELPNCSVTLIDIDEKALKVAKTNVDLFTLNLSIIKSDLLEQTDKNYDVLLCNLPYVPDNFQVNLAALHEPKIALFGGPDGLDVYRKLFNQVSNQVSQPLYILTESMPPQHSVLQSIASENAFDIHKTDDFIQVFISRKA
jgi:release factor glutamine methyltransferase